jgi:hypothetical protein
MADPGRIRVWLSVIGEHVDPAEITKLLGADPDRAHRVGDVVSSRATARRQTGAWIISSKDTVPESATLATHVSALLRRVPSDPAIWRSLADRHSIRVFVSWTMKHDDEGTGLEPSLLEELSRRSLNLDFNVYGPGVLEADE